MKLVKVQIINVENKIGKELSKLQIQAQLQKFHHKESKSENNLEAFFIIKVLLGFKFY